MTALIFDFADINARLLNGFREPDGAGRPGEPELATVVEAADCFVVGGSLAVCDLPPFPVVEVPRSPLTDALMQAAADRTRYQDEIRKLMRECHRVIAPE